MLLVVFLFTTMGWCAQARIDYTGHQVYDPMNIKISHESNSFPKVLKIGKMSRPLVNFLATSEFNDLQSP